MEPNELEIHHSRPYLPLDKVNKVSELVTNGQRESLDKNQTFERKTQIIDREELMERRVQ